MHEPRGAAPHMELTGTVKISVIDLQDVVKVDTTLVRRAARHAMKSEGRRDDISVVIVDDRRITELNEQYLGHAGPTDVISFNLDSPGDPDNLLGEVIVSAETARSEARKRRGDAGRELLLYTIHGVLHLLGFDDTDPGDADIMRRRQRELLKEFLEEQ